MANNPQQTKAITKSTPNYWIAIVFNLILALISVYLFEFWFKEIIALGNIVQKLTNMGVVALTLMTYFVANSYYIKGVANTAKKIFTVILFGGATVGLMLLSVKEPSDIIYPFSGVMLASIAFYMLSLTAGTLNTIGMVALGIILAAPIAFMKWFGYVDWATVGDLSKFAVFIILFIGGTWSHIRAALHGIRGVNPADSDIGDPNDGDGDTSNG